MGLVLASGRGQFRCEGRWFPWQELSTSGDLLERRWAVLQTGLRQVGNRHRGVGLVLLFMALSERGSRLKSWRPDPHRATHLVYNVLLRNLNNRHPDRGCRRRQVTGRRRQRHEGRRRAHTRVTVPAHLQHDHLARYPVLSGVAPTSPHSAANLSPSSPAVSSPSRSVSDRMASPSSPPPSTHPVVPAPPSFSGEYRPLKSQPDPPTKYHRATHKPGDRVAACVSSSPDCWPLTLVVSYHTTTVSAGALLHYSGLPASHKRKAPPN